MRYWLEKLRKKAGLTQEEAADLSNIARTTYAMIEQGNRQPSVKVAKNIAQTLNFEWTTFFDNGLHTMRKRDKPENSQVV